MTLSYAPASSIGWLDLDAAASERVGTLLRALEEPGTLDPLGLGSVRDTFAAILSPGTSTIQTRLRYFVFLPWLLKTLEADRVSSAQFAGRLRDREAQLINCLRPLGANQGVIGFTAGREIKRLPSEAYWGGLGAWRLRRLDLSLAEYGKRAAALGRLKPNRDDDGNVTSRSVAMWAPLPDPPDGFLHAPLTFKLRREEAQVLVDHIRDRHPSSLLAALCSSPDVAADADLPWDLPDAVLRGHLAEVVRHARCFSELTVGPQHVYNVLLARAARKEFGWDTSALEERESAEVQRWVALIEAHHARLRAWVDELDGFWALLVPFDTVKEPTRKFVKAMVTRAVTNPAGFLEDETVHAAIRNREIWLKTKRARLGNRTALESWAQEPFGGQLNYRWPITRGYLADMADGLNGDE